MLFGIIGSSSFLDNNHLFHYQVLKILIFHLTKLFFNKKLIWE